MWEDKLSVYSSMKISVQFYDFALYSIMNPSQKEEECRYPLRQIMGTSVLILMRTLKGGGTVTFLKEYLLY